MSIVELPLAQLVAHPDNANVMSDCMLAKLAEHIARTGQYPPLIVREHHKPGEANGAANANRSMDADHAPKRYQILDGHHRKRALEQLDKTHAQCVVWEVDDQQAIVLMTTLNRLEGQDDPRLRAQLVTRLAENMPISQLARQLPEDATKLKKLLEMARTIPKPRPPRPVADMPAAVHFFLKPADRYLLESTLRQFNEQREDALMAMVRTVRNLQAQPTPRTRETH